MEYLSSKANADPTLVQGMIRCLDALRRYDQHFCDADWLPQSVICEKSLKTINARIASFFIENYGSFRYASENAIGVPISGDILSGIR